MHIYDTRHIIDNIFAVELISVDEVLTPSYHGEKCRHNGRNPDYEIACDECDFALICVPDFEYLEENYNNSDDRSWETIKTSSDETLSAFLQADAAKEYINDLEIEIDLEVMEELSQRRIARGEEIDVKAAWERFTHGKGLGYFKDFNG